MSSKISLLIALFCLSLFCAQSQPKEWEKDVIYDEANVPHYELPDPLISVEGQLIKSRDEWLHLRRPQIMGMFASTIYGRIPVPEEKLEVTYETLSMDSTFLDGRCTRKHIQINFKNIRGSVSMHLALFLPNHTTKPVPVLLRMGFADAKGKAIDLENIQAYGRLKNGTPLIDFIDRGIGVACIKGGEVIPDEISFRRSIHALFYRGNQSLPRADEWGVLAGIAWQASRALDYLETVPEVDHQKVALLGFSKLGKCALWAAALDSRFAMVLSQNSGCAGAALWRRKFGENLKYMSRFPHWLCENAKKYIGVEEDLPIDQHMLIACMAPRPVYIVSGINDMWADNLGEYLSAFYATPVYKLFGLKGQETKERPRINQANDERALSYHIRSGSHGYEQFDWDQYLKFMSFHFQTPENE